MQKLISFGLAVVCVYLGVRVTQLEKELRATQRNAAIAVLSAELAHKKVGAIAPYFAEDKDAFASAWIDEANMPGAVFPEEVLVPIERELAARRADPVSIKQRAEAFP